MAIRLFQNLALKVVSVILAALLWLIVSGEQTVERVLRIPLEYTNIPAQLELVGEPQRCRCARARFVGYPRAVVVGRPGRCARRALAASRAALVSPDRFEVRSPFGVDVVQVTPSSIACSSSDRR
jgi:hypothetical protein